ncbi:aftiphilin [Nephila pilipes]|uniref:Aftiphilin n=1 Tax=Nephila pilipes TaxID=299642 RepID=A0A8X6TY69_NEPPI|nr:aftiphilin [Nephila pilipes]
MASNFIPMLSSSPPPLDDCPDNDDDDEEFGTFASANIPFDSSFDSPVAGDKYKPFKPGANGVNDISLNNDLNSYCSYNDSPMPSAAKFTLNFSPPNQSNCEKNVTQNESEDQFFADHIEKHCSSVDDIPDRKNSLTSQNCVPDSFSMNNTINNFCNPQEENDCLKNNEFPTCSTEETLTNKSNSLDAEHPNCDVDKAKKLFSVPPCDDVCMVKANSNDLHVAHSEISDNLQNTNNPVETFSIVDTSKSVIEKSDELNNKEDDSIKECKEFSENLDFNLPTSEQLDDFDEFQGTFEVINSQVICDESSRKSISGDEVGKETFEANFSDFQSDKECFEDDEFDDFQTNEDYHFEAQEFDEFQSFDKTTGICSSINEDIKSVDSITVPEGSEIYNSKEPVSPDSESEDFDDFQACSEVEQSFANFETQPLDQTEELEFADFEGASFHSAASETFQSSSSHFPSCIPNQEKNVDKLSTVMHTIFPLKEEELNVADVTYDPASEVLEQCNKSRRLWEKLHEVEQTPGLRFQWGVSHSFQQLLRSVNVDYHSILRTSSVPIFASSLSLLEPVKGQANSASQDSEFKIQSPKDPIPPVEFDWNSSGLVNPLDSGQAASILMDLSFLSSSESVSSTSVGNSSFENELLKPSPVPSCSESNNTHFILDELLSKNICSIPNSKSAHRQSNLSEEANSVLDQLPDLSFMRAKVLMFPISSKT